MSKRWFQNLVVVGSSALLVPGAAGFGFMAYLADDRLNTCIQHIQQHPDAESQEQRPVRPGRSGAPNQHEDPSNTREQIGAAYDDRAENSAKCSGLSVNPSDAIALASYEVSLLGYFAALFFGAIGVLGIFLGFSTARDARDDARRQNANVAATTARDVRDDPNRQNADIDAAGSLVERRSNVRLLLPLACIPLLYVGIRRIKSRRMADH